MTEPTNVVRFRQPDDVDDPLTEVLRLGARRLLDGRPRLVRHGRSTIPNCPTGSLATALLMAASRLRMSQ